MCLCLHSTAVNYDPFQVNEINANGNHLCSECWPKLEAFHEFYHMVEVTHRSRLRNENVKSTTESTLSSHKEAPINGENGVKHAQGLERTNNVKNEIKNISTSKKRKQPITVKKKVLKLNFNTLQSKEIKLQIEKDGENVRCNILKPTEAVDKTKQASHAVNASSGTVEAVTNSCTRDIDRNALESENDDSEDEICMPNYPTQQIKMEEELIISDDDNCDPTDEDDSQKHTQQSHEKPHGQQSTNSKMHNEKFDVSKQSTKCHICYKFVSTSWIIKHRTIVHNICRNCNRKFPSSAELTIHRLRCSKENRLSCCHLCNKTFRVPLNLKAHLEAVHSPNYDPHKNADFIKTANEKVFKKWASLISET